MPSQNKCSLLEVADSLGKPELMVIDSSRDRKQNYLSTVLASGFRALEKKIQINPEAEAW